MSVRWKIQISVFTDIRKNFISRSIYLTSQIFHSSFFIIQSDTPKILSSVSSGHIWGKIQVLSIRRYCRMCKNRQRIPGNLVFLRGTPFSPGTQRGKYLNRRIRIGFSSCFCQIHRTAIGTETDNSLIQLGIHLSFYQFGTHPCPFFILFWKENIIILHPRNIALSISWSLVVRRRKI